MTPCWSFRNNKEWNNEITFSKSVPLIKILIHEKKNIILNSASSQEYKSICETLRNELRLTLIKTKFGSNYWSFKTQCRDNVKSTAQSLNNLNQVFFGWIRAIDNSAHYLGGRKAPYIYSVFFLLKILESNVAYTKISLV